jgi:hypothetical protein
MKPYLIEAIDGSGCSPHWVNLDDVMAITALHSRDDYFGEFGVVLAFVDKPLRFVCRDDEAMERFHAGYEALLKAWKEREIDPLVAGLIAATNL